MLLNYNKNINQRIFGCMKKLIIIYLITAYSFGYADEFIIDSSGTSETAGIIFNDTSKYRLYKSSGYWKGSSGDYGLSKCFGTLKNSKDNHVKFEVYCKFTTQKKEHFILKFLRNTGYQDSGIGKATVVETSKKYEYLLNSECNHAITYIEKDFFSIQKCKF